MKYIPKLYKFFDNNLITVFLLFIFTVNYSIPIQPGACAISSVQKHESCYSHGGQDCKKQCNIDKKCQGFANCIVLDTTVLDTDCCVFATTSNCPTHFEKHDSGNRAPLIPQAEVDSERFSGCHIKQKGN